MLFFFRYNRHNLTVFRMHPCHGCRNVVLVLWFMSAATKNKRVIKRSALLYFQHPRSQALVSIPLHPFEPTSSEMPTRMPGSSLFLLIAFNSRFQRRCTRATFCSNALAFSSARSVVSLSDDKWLTVHSFTTWIFPGVGHTAPQI